MTLNRINLLKQYKNIISSHLVKITQNSFVINNIRFYAKKNYDELDKPIKFSTSDAAFNSPVRIRKNNNDVPWYQGIVASLSVGAILIYFCILREENDIDLQLGRSLYDQVEGLEEVNLKVARQYYLEQGNILEVDKIDERLKELEQIKSNKKRIHAYG